MGEFAHVLLRRAVDRGEALDEVDEVRALCRLRPFDGDVLTTMLGLLRDHPGLGARDAVQAATALSAGLAIVSADLVFDQVSGIRRLDPTDLAQELDPDA